MTGTVVGIAGTCPSRDPVAPGVGELDTIAIRSSHWRIGAGRALMAVANEDLDTRFARSVLWTWAGYEAAVAFYPTVGWAQTDVFRDDGRQVCFKRSADS